MLSIVIANAGLRSVSKQFANVPQQSCTRDRKFCKTFANVSILNAAMSSSRTSRRISQYFVRCSAVYSLIVTKGHPFYMTLFRELIVYMTALSVFLTFVADPRWNRKRYQAALRTEGKVQWDRALYHGRRDILQWRNGQPSLKIQESKSWTAPNTEAHCCTFWKRHCGTNYLI